MSSFMDKAKQKMKNVPKILGEETVRIVNFDDTSKEQSSSDTVREPKPQKSTQESKSKKPDTEKSSSSVFNLEEKVTFFGKKKKSDAIDEVADELGKVDQNKIKDVLEVLDIPATFEIGRETYLPEDISEVEFDYQAPHGYDMGQVAAFVEQARDSISNYVKLLKLRNEHIAKLATVVDRLQVDLNNQRFDSEIANGINIMPTQDDDDLNNQNVELRLLNMRLREELDALKNGDNLSDDERKKFDNLQDQLSIVNRENETLRDENYNLKTQLSYIEEDLSVDPVENEKEFESGNNSFENHSEITYQSFADGSDGLPDFGSPSLPDFSDESDDNPNSAFFDSEDTTLDEFIKENQESYDGESDFSAGDFSMIEVMGEPSPLPAEVQLPEDEVYPEVTSSPRAISVFDEEDDDDELEAIMRQEFGDK
jgi:cell division septum initiation protein DivIVA